MQCNFCRLLRKGGETECANYVRKDICSQTVLPTHLGYVFHILSSSFIVHRNWHGACHLHGLWGSRVWHHEAPPKESVHRQTRERASDLHGIRPDWYDPGLSWLLRLLRHSCWEWFLARQALWPQKSLGLTGKYWSDESCNLYFVITCVCLCTSSQDTFPNIWWKGDSIPNFPYELSIEEERVWQIICELFRSALKYLLMFTQNQMFYPNRVFFR